MSLQVLHPNHMNQWVPPHLGQQQMAYYYCDQQQVQAQNTPIQHWSNISPRESESEESDGSSCHSSVSNPSPRSEYGIFDTSLADESRFETERSVSPALSERSGKKTPTCLGILDEMEDLSLSEPSLPKVNIPAATMAFVQQSVDHSGLSVSAPPTPREASTVGQPWMPMSARSSSASTTPNFGVRTPTEYAPVAANGAPAGSNHVGVFPPTTTQMEKHVRVDGSRNHRHRRSSRHRQQAASQHPNNNHHHQQQHHHHAHHSQQQQHHQQHAAMAAQANADYFAGGSMMYLQDQLQQIQYQQQLQYQQYYAMQQQAAAYQHMVGNANSSYGYSQQQQYAYPNGMPVGQANAYNCM